MLSPAKLPVTRSVAPTFADDVIVTAAVNLPAEFVVPDGVPVVPFPLKLIFSAPIPVPPASESVKVLPVVVTVNVLPHFKDVALKVGVERDVTCFATCIVVLEEDAR